MDGMILKKIFFLSIPWKLLMTSLKFTLKIYLAKLIFSPNMYIHMCVSVYIYKLILFLFTEPSVSCRHHDILPQNVSACIS